MKRQNIKIIFNEDMLTAPDSGKLLCNNIMFYLKENYNVIVDMIGVKFLTDEFIIEAFAKLFSLGISFSGRVAIKNAPPMFIATIKQHMSKYAEQSKEYDKEINMDASNYVFNFSNQAFEKGD